MIKLQKEKYTFSNANGASFQSGAFADDIVIVTDINESINKLFEIIEKYLIATDVKLNYNKCEYVTNNTNEKQTINSMIPTKEIQNRGPKHSFKYLRVYINLELNFNRHQKHVLEKLNPIIKKLYRMPINGYQMANAINVLVLPILTYGSEIIKYTPMFIEDIDMKCRKLTKKAAKMPRCTQTNFVYATQKKGGLGVNKLKDRMKAIQINFFYKNLIGKRDKNLSTIIDNMILIEHARAKTNSLFTQKNIKMKENN